MKLYDMLDRCVYYQYVWIYKTNDYDQNMPIFKGTIEEAREEGDEVWSELMDDVNIYEFINGILIILVTDEHCEERMETQYIGGEKWGRAKKDRPWRHSAELEEEARGYE